jgi:hypothetical protein
MGRLSLGQLAKRYAKAHDAFEEYASRPDITIGGEKWNRLWRKMYGLRERYCNLALRKFSAYKPPYFYPPFKWKDTPTKTPKRSKPHLRVISGGKKP